MKASKILIAKLQSKSLIQPLHVYTLPELYLESIEVKTESVYYSIEELIPYFFTQIPTNNFDQIFKSTGSDYDLIKDENTGMTLISSDYLHDIARQNKWLQVALFSQENKIGLINGKISSVLESLRLPNIRIYTNFKTISLDIKPAKLRSISVPPCNQPTSPLSDNMKSENSPKISQTSSSTPQYKPMLPKLGSQALSFDYPHRPQQQQQVHKKLPDSLRLLDNSLPSAQADYAPKRAIPRYTPAPKTLVQSTYTNPTARVRGRPRKPVTNPYPQASISPSLGHFGHFKVDPPPQEMILLPPTTPSALRPRYHSPPINKSPLPQPRPPPHQPVHRPPFDPKLRPSPPMSRQPTGSEHPLEWCRKEVYNLISLSSELSHRLHKLEECMSNLQPHQPSPQNTPHQAQQHYPPSDANQYSSNYRQTPR